MFLLLSLQTAWANLRANKMRSALTMLGVIIGVSSVILMVSIVEGARDKVVTEFNRLGSQLMLVVYAPTPEEWKQNAHHFEGLTLADSQAISAECSLVRDQSAEVMAGNNGSSTARYHGRESQVSLSGAQPIYAQMHNSVIADGRFLTDDDIAGWNKVCVLGSKVAKELFPGEEPLGQEIQISGETLTVVGVLEPKGHTGDQDNDTVVLVPLSTLQKRLMGSELVSVIWAQPTDPARMDQAMDQVWQCLMRHHHNTPGFRVDSQENILKTVGRVLSIFGLVLGSVAGLALLVGGIGIMNIMLVSVTERTREIGIRKAVGAQRSDILLQFLIESGAVSGIGGLVGIALGTGAAHAMGAISQKVMQHGPLGDPGIPIYTPAWAVLGGFAFSVFVGVFFGIYPAMRAASMDPIRALRHE